MKQCKIIKKKFKLQHYIIYLFYAESKCTEINDNYAIYTIMISEKEKH